MRLPTTGTYEDHTWMAERSGAWLPLLVRDLAKASFSVTGRALQTAFIICRAIADFYDLEEDRQDGRPNYFLTKNPNPIIVVSRFFIES